MTEFEKEVMRACQVISDDVKKAQQQKTATIKIMKGMGASRQDINVAYESGEVEELMFDLSCGVYEVVNHD